MKVHLKIKGMHCNSCEVLIKEVLTEKGVTKSDVDSKKGTVTLEFDEKKINLTKIKKIIEAEGYQVD